MTKKCYKERIKVLVWQHGGERPSYGHPVKAVLVKAAAGPRSPNITIHVGEERRHAVLVQLDAAALCEAAQEIQERANSTATSRG